MSIINVLFFIYIFGHLTLTYKVYIYIYIYIYIMYRIKIHNLVKISNISLLFRSFVNVKENFKVQTKAQITHQNNRSKLKNTYRVKELIVKDNIYVCVYVSAYVYVFYLNSNWNICKILP